MNPIALFLRAKYGLDQAEKIKARLDQCEGVDDLTHIDVNNLVHKFRYLKMVCEEGYDVGYMPQLTAEITEAEVDLSNVSNTTAVFMSQLSLGFAGMKVTA